MFELAYLVTQNSHGDETFTQVPTAVCDELARKYLEWKDETIKTSKAICLRVNVGSDPSVPIAIDKSQ